MSDDAYEEYVGHLNAELASVKADNARLRELVLTLEMQIDELKARSE